jgi:hypothetical protein
MSNCESPPSALPRIRRDGWTGTRQLTFLQALAATRQVSLAAAAAGMRRESAYRLRRRPEGALFALLWDRTLGQPMPQARPAPALKGHIGDGALLRQLARAARRGSLQGHGNAEGHTRR